MPTFLAMLFGGVAVGALVLMALLRARPWMKGVLGFSGLPLGIVVATLLLAASFLPLPFVPSVFDERAGKMVDLSPIFQLGFVAGAGILACTLMLRQIKRAQSGEDQGNKKRSESSDVV